ncbi:NAD(P)H-binding protein [Glycomyces sp. TRM65418]|uniref:NAD(P)H-binding protein n=1 Tax=Glycomyces sp. TRM65418 TaxID=2867006 RepID=UPI001CE4BC0F|nr:NAD(P)H-binding protein [Glycomyces sp. TRM65418]MCC3764363.1 NAD(P)H-binding protein [Glycomyces sp. TRM65418]QZD54042.1 NAD(P)H-binding protein [Glycomyces sp. TRM65418]
MIGVTGSTGGVGSGVVRHLLAAGRDDLAALARRPEAIPPAPGLEARRADYDDPASLKAAMRDLDVLVMVSSDGRAETMERHHRNVIAAADAAGVGRIVYTSILDVAPGSGFYYAPGHQATEALLAGRPHCLARTSVFADFFTDSWLGAALTTGELVLPLGQAGMSLVAREDVSRALAAAVLDGLEGVLELTGPENATGDRIAALASEATGMPLTYRPIGDADYRPRLQAAGEPDWLIEAYASMFASVRAGRFASAPGDVERLTGTPPVRFDAFLRTRLADGGS